MGKIHFSWENHISEVRISQRPGVSPKNGYYKLQLHIKEVQIIYRLFLVNCYLMHGNRSR